MSPELAVRLATLLRPAARAFAINLSAQQIDLLARYCERLLEWNQRINLTGARDLSVLASEHIADAFALVPHLPTTGRCIDVGSGAGLPGLVLAVLRPDLAITLLEPIQKRRAFLSAVIRELGLERVSVSGEHLEDQVARNPAAYDFAMARAVFPLLDWLREGSALVRSGGSVAGLAGGGCEVVWPGASIHRYDVGAGSRAVVIVRK